VFRAAARKAEPRQPATAESVAQKLIDRLESDQTCADRRTPPEGLTTLLSDDEIATLSDDPDEAFIQVIRMARRKADAGVYADNESPTPYIVGYFGAVRAAGAAYEMDVLVDLRVPDPSDSDLLDQYHRINAQVDEFILQLQLVRRRNLPIYSVSLDAAAKTKIHHFIAQIREVIEAADLDADKRNALFDKLHDLALEVDKNRTAFQRTMSALMTIAPVAERAARIVAKILGVMRDAKEEEERVFKSVVAPKPKLKLPPPSKPKRPKRETFNQDLDDEIPF
jgi:hypothetical protein